MAWLDAFIKRIKSVSIAGQEIPVPKTAQPVGANFVSGVSGSFNSSTGNLDLTVTAAGGVTSVAGTPPIVSSGGATPNISISAATDSTAGSMSAADKTKLDAVLPLSVSPVDLAVQSVANNIGGGDQWTTGGANNSIGVGFAITDTVNTHTCSGMRYYWKGTVQGSHAITAFLYENQSGSAVQVASQVVTPPATDGVQVATWGAGAYTLKAGVTYVVGYWSAGTLTIVGNFNSDLSFMWTAFAVQGFTQASAFHAYVVPQRNGGSIASPINLFNNSGGAPAYPNNDLSNYCNPIEPVLT